ncbi:MAG: hypothetical protein RLZZ223_404 [Candidatus Parcubacteria bacterium]|jgi:hypothetical protein
MTLADSIQSQINKDIEKLETQYKEDLKETKNTWDRALSETKKLHAEKIDEAVATQINFHKFQQSKAQKFHQGYSIQTQLNSIYQDIIPEIINSTFVKNSIQKTLQDIPNSTILNISGQYYKDLENLAKNLGYKTKSSEMDSKLGTITAKLDEVNLEITVEDILDTVKQKTLPVVMKEI